MKKNKETAKKSIVVADDDPAIVDALQFMLEEEGYSVRTTVDGQTVSVMFEEEPDLLLLDIWMSGQDGRDICKFLKSRETTKDIPIIMISANKDTQEIAKEAGADGFITKPFEMNDLLDKVAKCIDRVD